MLKAFMRTLLVGAVFVLVAGAGVDRANAQSLNTDQLNALQAAVAVGNMEQIQALTAQIFGANPSNRTVTLFAELTLTAQIVGPVPGAAANAEAIAEAMGKGVVQGSIAAGGSNAVIAGRVGDAVRAMVLSGPPASKVAIARGAVSGSTSQAGASGIAGLTNAVGGQAVAGAIEAAIDGGLSVADIYAITTAATTAAVEDGASPQSVAIAALQAGANLGWVTQGLADAGVPNAGDVVKTAQAQIQINQLTGDGDDEDDTSPT